MAKKIDIIEFNGHSFDAQTGDRLDASQPAGRQPHALAAHQPHPAKTLMRRAVKKPAGSASHSDTTQQSTPKLSDRERRAKLTKQSEQIRHFNPNVAETAKVEPTILPSFEPAAPQGIIQAEPFNRSEQLAHHIEKALKEANSHHQPKAKVAKKPASHKSIAVAGSALLLALVGVFIALNLAPLKIKLATARSEVNANLSHQPAGFSLSSLSYGPGKLAASFLGRSGSYQLTAQKVLWSNTDLVNNYLVNHCPGFHSSSISGRTVYQYGSGNATWLKNGVWYNLTNKAGLSQTQLASLVTSL